MSPLSEAIYPILAQRVGLKNPLITYSELVRRLPPLDPFSDDIAANDDRLFQALYEVGHACHDHGLPTLTALVIRSIEQSPGGGYYHAFHSEISNDPVRQREAWEQELGRLKATKYPPILKQGAQVTHETADDHQSSRSLGILRIADNVQKSTAVFTGRMTCPNCSMSIDVEVKRNPKAVMAKQPAFVIMEAGTPSRDKSIGHLFMGTHLKSPVLYC